jgi:signal transduction histidine kinase
MTKETTASLALNRVDPVQRMIQDALAIVFQPTVVMVVLHVGMTFLSTSFTLILVLHALFSILLAYFATQKKMDWSRAAIAIGSAGWTVAAIAGLLTFLRTFSVATFFALLTDPFIIASFTAVIGGVAVLAIPAIQKLYQK